MRIAAPLLILLALLSPVLKAELSLDTAIQDALTSDDWHRSNLHQQQALQAQAIASGQLPDPKLRLALANLPADSFDFQQENMTHMQLGFSQAFPRGDTLALKQAQWQQRADKSPLQRQQRAAQLKLQVSQAWLGVHQADAQLELLKKKRHLFSEMIAVARANYRSGKADRHEVLDAELSLTTFTDQQLKLQQLRAAKFSLLQQWLSSDNLGKPLAKGLELLPLLALQASQTETDPVILRHPSVQALGREIEIEQTAVALAKEAYKPAFKIDANYGYRGDHPNGRTRADLFSVALTLDLPLFPEKRQDQKQRAAVQQREAAKAIYLLKARELRAELAVAQANLRGYEQRLNIYSSTYLNQLAAKRKSALRAYASARTSFKTVATAALEELAAQQQRISLQHQYAVETARLNYYFAGIDKALMQSERTGLGGLENE